MKLLAVLLCALSDEQRAQALLDHAHEEEAIAVLNTALASETEKARRARLEVLLGVARHNLRDEAGAQEAFSQAVADDPGAVLPAHTSPKTRELFLNVRTRAPPAPAAALVEARPAPPPREVRWRPWVVVAVGALALGSGVGVTRVAVSERNRAQALDSAEQSQGVLNGAQALNGVGWGLVALGAVAVVAGIAWLLWQP
jgi:hypothetical protein